jgi:tripartite-type tricarboxylate transporter receptor subunit TctC
MRKLASWATIFLATASWLAVALADDAYPSRPVRVLVGFSPGGGTDLTTRLVGAKLSERLGQAFVVENRVGAGGNVALAALAQSAPDGYTLAVGVSSMTINVTFQPDLPFNPERNFAPITMLANNPLILVSNPAFPAKDLRQLVTVAKSQPGKIAYGSAGVGNVMHLAGALLDQAAGIELFHVPYKGNAPAINAVLAGEVPIAFADVASTLPLIKAGRLRAIALLGSKGTPVAPGVPTISESGFPGFSVGSWTGFIAPIGTPPDIVNKLNSALVAVLKSAEIREKFLEIGVEPAPMTPKEFGDVIKGEIPKWRDVLLRAGVKPQ